ncbi:MAG: hypothetical protein ACXVBQ_04640 [Pseudobdellovibrionaceae bacterium]
MKLLKIKTACLMPVLFSGMFFSEMSRAACDLTLNPGDNVASAAAAAAAGSTICLNPGNYGSQTFSSGTKSPPVIVKSVSGQTAAMSLTINNTANGYTFDSLIITGSSQVSGSAAGPKNITISRSSFGTNPLAIYTNNFNNNNILIDQNTFGAYNASSGEEGRLYIGWHGGPGPYVAGVVVTNNKFGPGGCSDGIQLGGNGAIIGPGNEFTGIVQGNCTAHVDAIQGYGDINSTITGNYIHDVSVCLGWYDRSDNVRVTNNILTATGNSVDNCVTDLLSCVNVVFDHNTMFGKYSAGLRLGPGNQSGDTTGTFTNNIFDSSTEGNIGSTCATCTFSNNLANSTIRGTNNVIGVPSYLGGTLPSTWAGFQLAPNSLGHNAGSDGKDLGINYYGTNASVVPISLAAPTNLRIVQ